MLVPFRSESMDDVLPLIICLVLALIRWKFRVLYLYMRHTVPISNKHKIPYIYAYHIVCSGYVLRWSQSGRKSLINFDDEEFLIFVSGQILSLTSDYGFLGICDLLNKSYQLSICVRMASHLNGANSFRGDVCVMNWMFFSSLSPEWPWINDTVDATAATKMTCWWNSLRSHD